MFETTIFICIGYLSGSVLYARIFARIFKKEILEQSVDHNPGTANAFIYGGFWCGILTLIFDVLKGFIPVFLFMRYGTTDETNPFFTALVIAAPVIGHIFPLHYWFHGGKGIAVTFGSLAGLYPALDALFILAFFFIIFSVVLTITPHFYRTFFSYAVSFMAVFRSIEDPSVVLGFLVITAAVLVRLLTSKEKRSRLEVKLFGGSHTLLRDRGADITPRAMLSRKSLDAAVTAPQY